MTRSTVAMILAPGWRKTTTSTLGLPLKLPILLMFCDGILDIGNVAQANRSAIL